MKPMLTAHFLQTHIDFSIAGEKTIDLVIAVNEQNPKNGECIYHG